MRLRLPAKIKLAKQVNIALANKCIADALLGMDKWIFKGNRKNGLVAIFLDCRSAMQRYYLRLTYQTIRQAQVHKSANPPKTVENALQLYSKEPRRADKAIPSILLHYLNAKLDTSVEYNMIDVNNYMEDMSRQQRHQYLLQV